MDFSYGEEALNLLSDRKVQVRIAEKRAALDLRYASKMARQGWGAPVTPLARARNDSDGLVEARMSGVRSSSGASKLRSMVSLQSEVLSARPSSDRPALTQPAWGGHPYSISLPSAPESNSRMSSACHSASQTPTPARSSGAYATSGAFSVRCSVPARATQTPAHLPSQRYVDSAVLPRSPLLPRLAKMDALPGHSESNESNNVPPRLLLAKNSAAFQPHRTAVPAESNHTEPSDRAASDPLRGFFSRLMRRR
jgi:hypothetical protein